MDWGELSTFLQSLFFKQTLASSVPGTRSRMCESFEGWLRGKCLQVCFCHQEVKSTEPQTGGDASKHRHYRAPTHVAVWSTHSLPKEVYAVTTPPVLAAISKL